MLADCECTNVVSLLFYYFYYFSYILFLFQRVIFASAFLFLLCGFFMDG